MCNTNVTYGEGIHSTWSYVGVSGITVGIDFAISERWTKGR